MRRESNARQQMITSAALLQRKQGVPGTGIRAVLEHSGAPRGSVYHHFPLGRAQMAQEATAFAADVLGSALEQLLTEKDPGDALEAFSAIWAEVLRSEDFAAGCPVAAGALDYTPESGAREVAAAGFDRWCCAIADALERKRIPRLRALQFAHTTVAAFEGALVLCRASRSVEPLEAVTGFLQESVERELAAI